MANPKRAAVILAVGDRSGCDDGDGLAFLAAGADPGSIVCDVGAVTRPDVGTIDALARLQLIARRHGRRVQLRHASVELQELLSLLGLFDVLPPCAELSLEPRGQPEDREQAVGVQEKGDAADPIA